MPADAYYGVGQNNAKSESYDAVSPSTLSSGSEISEKIISTADATVETLSYDETLAAVEAMAKEYGGYIESSEKSDSGLTAYASGYASPRRAYYTLRIPAEKFDLATQKLQDFGSVTYLSVSTENITTQYYDTQSRLEAYRTQESRLLELMEQAQTVDDVLRIQSQLTEVQYEIDSLETTLRYYDRRVSYSTLSLTVREVAQYSETGGESLGTRLSQGFKRGLKDTGEFFEELLLFIVSNLVAIIAVAAVIVLAVMLIRKKRRARKAKAPEPPPEEK